MRYRFPIFAAFLFLQSLNADQASGPQVSDPAGSFTVVKCSGANDGVEAGTELCYRTKYGSSPQVIVFARNAESVKGLAIALDGVTGPSAKLRAFINILGSDPVAAENAATALGKDASLKNIVVTVPVESAHGPVSYAIDPKTQLTVLVIVNGVVTANHVGEAAGEDFVKTVLTSAKEAAG